MGKLPYPILKYLELSPEKLEAIIAEYPFYLFPRIAKILDLNKLAGEDIQELNYFGFNTEKLSSYAQNYSQVEVETTVEIGEDKNFNIIEESPIKFDDIQVDIIDEIKPNLEIENNIPILKDLNQADEVSDTMDYNLSIQELPVEVEPDTKQIYPIDHEEVSLDENVLELNMTDSTLLDENLLEGLDIEFSNSLIPDNNQAPILTDIDIINEASENILTDTLIVPIEESIPVAEELVLAIDEQKEPAIEIELNRTDDEFIENNAIDFEFLNDKEEENETTIEKTNLDNNEDDDDNLQYVFITSQDIAKHEFIEEEVVSNTTPINTDTSEETPLEEKIENKKFEEDNDFRDFNTWLTAFQSESNTIAPIIPSIKNLSNSESTERVEKNLLSHYPSIDKKSLKPNNLNVDEELDNVLNDHFFKNQVETKKTSRKTPADIRLQDEALQSLKPLDIISETMAILYVQQGNIPRAIEVYEKLIDLFPEKSSFFAVQIEKLKK